MAIEKQVSLVLGLVLSLLVTNIAGNADIMKDIALGFGEAHKHCRDESELTPEKMQAFSHFWDDDFKFEQRELGCAIECMSRHFNLLTEEGKMHHDNADKFIRSFPKGEQIAQQLLDIVHACETKNEAQEDHCWRVLHTAECFIHSAKEQNIAPSVDMLMAEFVVAES
uniref:Odorant-binding protein 1 n=1 Tax=Carposina sasakii TaxID=252295 RepID=A0A2U9PF24_CARSA|nr:odorant-binding protein 1 [Carposina sasakii]